MKYNFIPRPEGLWLERYREDTFYRNTWDWFRRYFEERFT